MKRGTSLHYSEHFLVNLKTEELEALERLLEREQQNSAYAQVREMGLAVTRERERVARIRALETQVAILEAKEIDGRTERRVSQRRGEQERRDSNTFPCRECNSSKIVKRYGQEGQMKGWIEHLETCSHKATEEDEILLQDGGA